MTNQEHILAIDAYTRVVSLKLRIDRDLDFDPAMGDQRCYWENVSGYVAKLEALEARLEAFLKITEEDLCEGSKVMFL